MRMENNIIQLKGVSKSYQNNSVIKDITVDFANGKCYGVMGYNGSGKSVILKLIAGYAFADSGEIIINGKILKKDIDFIQNAGVIINAPEFINSMSGLKNLMYLAEIRKVIKLVEVEDILKRMRLYDARHKKVSTYSQGMKQRLRLSQALMESPEILLLDEPMNALDKEGIALVKGILKEHVNRGNTLIFTSHQREDFIDLADEVFEIEDGSLASITI